MGLDDVGKSVNVEYGAKIGENEKSWVFFNEGKKQKINNSLNLSEKNEIDFSVFVYKFPLSLKNRFNGNFTLSAVFEDHLRCDAFVAKEIYLTSTHRAAPVLDPYPPVNRVFVPAISPTSTPFAATDPSKAPETPILGGSSSSAIPLASISPAPMPTAEPSATPVSLPDVSPAPSQELFVEPSSTPDPSVTPVPSLDISPAPESTLTPTPSVILSPSPTVLPESSIIPTLIPTVSPEPVITFPSPEPSNFSDSTPDPLSVPESSIMPTALPDFSPASTSIPDLTPSPNII
jgi:hypothetical protein